MRSEKFRREGDTAAVGERDAPEGQSRHQVGPECVLLKLNRETAGPLSSRMEKEVSGNHQVKGSRDEGAASELRLGRRHR